MKRVARHSMTMLVLSWLCVAQAQDVAVPQRGERLLLPPLDEGASKQARRQLANFQELFDDEELKALGLRERGDLAELALGPPFQIWLVQLGDLRAVTQRSRSLDAMRKSRSVVYPVLVRGVAVSSVTIVKEPDGWRPGPIGGANRIRVLDAMRRRLVREQKLAEAEVFLVRIPALNGEFVCYNTSAGVAAVPLWTDGPLGVRAGKTMLLSELLWRLGRVSKSMDGRSPG